MTCNLKTTVIMSGTTGKESAGPNVKFEKFVEDVPISGTKEIYMSQNIIEKIVWTIIVLSGTGLTIYYIFKVFAEYQENPTATKIYYARNETYEFPNLYVCPPVWYDDDKIKATGLSDKAILFALSYLLDYHPPNLKELNVEAIKQEFLEHLNENHFESILDFYYSIALESETFIDSCDNCVTKYNLTKVSFCNTICYQLQVEPVDSRLQTAIEPLMLKLVGQNKSELTYLPVIRKYYALVLDIDQKFPVPYKEVFLHPDTVTDVYITPKVNIFLNTKERPCNEFCTEDYSQRMCHTTCVQKQFMAECLGCFDLGYFEGPSTDTDEFPLCNTHKFRPPYRKCRPVMLEAAKYCDEMCPLRCVQEMYDLSLTMSKQYVGTLEIDIDTNSTVAVIRYQVAAFGLQHFEEVSTFSLETMISNVGGQLGLWIGASVMTLVQLIMFCLRMCWTAASCRFWRTDKVRFKNEKF